MLLGCFIPVLYFAAYPILTLILSFNNEQRLTFTSGMMLLKSEAYSLKHWGDLFNNGNWRHSLKNSIIIGVLSTGIIVILLYYLPLENKPLELLLKVNFLSGVGMNSIIFGTGAFLLYERLGKWPKTTLGPTITL